MNNKGEIERYIQLKADFQRTAQRDKKIFFNEQYIKLKKTTEGKTLEIFSGNWRYQGNILSKDGHNKGHK